MLAQRGESGEGWGSHRLTHLFIRPPTDAYKARSGELIKAPGLVALTLEWGEGGMSRASDGCGSGDG